MNPRNRLLVASVHMMFLELMLIRWLGSNVVHLAYFSNFILLGSFLGIGIGFLRASRATYPPTYGPIALGLLVLVVSIWPVTIERETTDILFFTSLIIEGPPAWLILPLLFLCTAIIMAGAGEWVGIAFSPLPALTAYRVHLLGCLAGILLFTAIAWVGWPPLVWGLVPTVGYLLLLAPAGTPVIVLTALCVTLACMTIESVRAGYSWSPYHKLLVEGSPGWGYTISGNGIPHQNIQSPEAMVEREPIYSSPYDRVKAPTYTRALVIGAGTGSDVALALGRGIPHVDAVEIDPGIIEIGREFHPNKPYADSRVTLHIDDGRSFLRRCPDNRYDLIIFALPGSQQAVRGSGQLRLESYLFTQEAFTEVHRVLATNGVFVMYDYYREPWLADRLAGTVAAAFGHAPSVQVYGEADQRGTAIVASRDPARPLPPAWVPTGDLPAPTDERPFVYLRERTIPVVYRLALLGIILTSLAAIRWIGGRLSSMSSHIDLGLLGAGFLLIETRSVASFSLLFGTTWIVNAAVFAGILLAVLAATESARRWPALPPWVLYAGLGITLLVAWAVPLQWLLGLPIAPRLMLATLLSFTPIFFSSQIFSARLALSSDPATAMAVNLFGAMLGGCLEYSALILGYRHLLLVAAVLYAAACVLSSRTRRRST